MEYSRYCSPDKAKNPYTCYTDKSLLDIVENFNESRVDKIKIPKNSRLTNKQRENLWKTLKERLKSEMPCNEDYCLLESPTLKNLKNRNSILDDTFLPEKPIEWYQDKYTWLSNVDIEKVMRLYEMKYDFKFLAASPIDFDSPMGGFRNLNMCVVNELCNVNIKNLYLEGKHKIGVIYNLDPHYKSGSHWTALFADLDKGGIYYFDSYGIEPPNEVKVFMERIRNQGNLLLQKDIIPLDGIEYESHHKFSKISTKKIKVDNVQNLLVDNLIFFGKRRGKKIEIFKETYNKITSINRDENTITLSRNVDCEDCNVMIVKGFKIFYNNVRFQYGNSECGMFSMHFIIEFLNGKSFNDIITNVIDDETVNKKRDELFRPNLNRFIENKI